MKASPTNAFPGNDIPAAAGSMRTLRAAASPDTKAMMTPDQFRTIALSMPQAIESEHMDHPDFRVGGKIFASLLTKKDVDWGMVKLKPTDQARFMKAKPEMFEPASGAWGVAGATMVLLKKATKTITREAM